MSGTSAGGIDDSHHICHEFGHSIRRDLCRAIRRATSSLVRDDDVIAGLNKRRHLMPPQGSVVRPSVKQEHRGPHALPMGFDVESDIPSLDPTQDAHQ
jgi:hypothetical protein